MFAGIALVALRRVGGSVVVEALADAPNAHAVADNVWWISTSLLVDAPRAASCSGCFLHVGAWLIGEGRRATAIRRASAHPFREHAGAVRAGLGVAILLLVIWGPVPWTQRWWGILIFTVLAFVWLERIRTAHARAVPGRAAAAAIRTSARARARPGRASSSGWTRCACAAC